MTSFIDATCVCTSSSSSGQCAELAQNLVSLTPTVNTLFATNWSTNDISNAIYQAQGAPTGTNCASQSLLVDVAPGLNSETAPNRTTWTQAAILWNLVLSQDTTATSTLRDFATNADWDKAASDDGPVADSSSLFAVNASGYTFDFASQVISRPNITFVESGQPSNAQLGEVSSVAEAALDRMYTFASGDCFFEKTSCLMQAHHIHSFFEPAVHRFIFILGVDIATAG